MVGKQFTDLTKASALKDSDIFAVHDGNGLKKSSIGDVTAYMSDKFSNPNLLINPDFNINQKGKKIYNTEPKSIYTVDRWSIYMPTGGSVKLNSDGTITVTNNSNDQGWFFQKLENKIENSTLTANVISVSGTVNIYLDNAGKTIANIGIVSLQSESAQTCGFVLTANSSITLKWVKLEQGSIATPFIAPNHTEELMKCKYFFKLENIKNHLLWAGGQWAYVLIPKTEGVRISPTITLSDLSIEYSGASGLYGKKNITSATVFATTAEYIIVQLNSNFGFSSYTPVMCTNNTNVIIDAEIY